MKIDDTPTLVDSFIDYLQSVRKLSLHTVEAYRRDLATLISCDDLKNIDINTLRRLLMNASQRGLSAASIARRLSAWRAFFDYLCRREIIHNNPTAGIKPPKKKARLPRALTPDQISHFLETDASSDNWLTLRDNAMFELLYSTGIRVGEMVQLNVEDIDIAADSVYIRRGKGGYGRVTPLGRKAAAALQTWLVKRAAMAKSQALFINYAGGALTTRTVQQRVNYRSRVVGGVSKISPHVFRHSCASHFLQSSGDLRATQDLLGHRDIASTQIYTRLDFQNLARAYDRAHPRAKK